MGFAATRTRRASWCSHKAITVNGKPVNIASYQSRRATWSRCREKAQKQLRIQAALQIKAQVDFPAWVEVDDEEVHRRVQAVPDRDEILPDINENLIVELYSK